MAAGVAPATWLQRLPIRAEASIAQLHASFADEGGAVPGEPGRQHAIEHIYAATNRIDKVPRCAHTHEVAGLGCRQQRGGKQHDLLNERALLANGNAAYGKAREVE